MPIPMNVLTITDGNDNGVRDDFDNNPAWYEIATSFHHLLFGNCSDLMRSYCQSFTIFRNSSIPQGSVIYSAFLKYKIYDNQATTGIPTRLYVKDDVNPARYNSGSMTALDYFDKAPLVSGSVPWIMPQVGNVLVSSPDLKELIQALVNKPNWTTGCGIMILHKLEASRSDNQYMWIESYAKASGGPAPELEITYGSAPPPVTVKDNALFFGMNF